MTWLSVSESTSDKVRWQYKSVNVRNHKHLQRVANRMARDGWELDDSARRGALAWKPGSTDVTFRRPKKPSFLSQAITGSGDSQVTDVAAESTETLAGE